MTETAVPTPTAREVRKAAEATGPEPASRVSLTWEDRYLRRRMLRTEDGAPLLVDLPETVDLGPGDRLILTDGREVAVRAAAEPLAEVRADGATLARLAWHIGNRHTPCQIGDGRLLIRHDHVLEDMLTRLGAEVAHVEAPFRPEGGAYGHGRTHGHSHSHDPHHDPNAHIPHRHGPHSG